MGGEPGEHLHVDVGLAPPAEIQVSRLPDVFDVKRKRTGHKCSQPQLGLDSLADEKAYMCHQLRRVAQAIPLLQSGPLNQLLRPPARHPKLAPLNFPRSQHYHPSVMSEESKIPPADNRTTPGDKTRSTTLPLCWGHRGASATFPENTLCSFEAAIKDGAEGIESDVHVSADDVILMFHDPSLERTTDGKGKIESLNYRNGIDGFRTLERPHQKIPTFDETLDLLMEKENQHVILNVDCKPNNDPARLFKLIKTSIDRYAAHETSLNGRIILGIWHPKFIGPSVEILPDLKKVYIGTSPSTARKYFWESCSGFSMKFSCLVGFEGQKFRQDCIKYHKSLFVWTVNDRLEMIEASKWGVDAILTDKTADYLELRRQMKDDWEAITAETSILFPYRSIHYNGLVSWLWGTIDSYSLARSVGPFHSISTQ
ncbi:hypothetical protein MJO29_000823 [Puccinia striiformis f. sp. tritici]|uniref:hypothetical protein n=1 Tax=Puccinia striiformis f. sp. tritici TaxID=168172 RepID=UPI00200872B9|nr:hypothetical protein Pst134EA_000835 [Puccinia striiformis f. sp. tritici]KAH9473767.1 hypothetical protein Pst134EA_000835 [Puccinia striiformis f. sp. tritici]KAI7967546.1 hypothetical protein MJO29_000823 [Puccinia striiformis f. sp. tritici]